MSCTRVEVRAVLTTQHLWPKHNTQVGAVPATVTTADIVQLATHFTSKQQEAVVNATAVMGFLNRFMCARQKSKND